MLRRQRQGDEEESESAGTTWVVGSFGGSAAQGTLERAWLLFGRCMVAVGLFIFSRRRAPKPGLPFLMLCPRSRGGRWVWYIAALMSQFGLSPQARATTTWGCTSTSVPSCRVECPVFPPACLLQTVLPRVKIANLHPNPTRKKAKKTFEERGTRNETNETTRKARKQPDSPPPLPPFVPVWSLAYDTYMIPGAFF